MVSLYTQLRDYEIIIVAPWNSPRKIKTHFWKQAKIVGVIMYSIFSYLQSIKQLIIKINKDFHVPKQNKIKKNFKTRVDTMMFTIKHPFTLPLN